MNGGHDLQPPPHSYATARVSYVRFMLVHLVLIIQVRKQLVYNAFVYSSTPSNLVIPVLLSILARM